MSYIEKIENTKLKSIKDYWVDDSIGSKKYETYKVEIKDLKPRISDIDTPILENITNELLSDLICEYSLVYYYNLFIRLLSHQKATIILLGLNEIKRIIKRFRILNGKFLNLYRKVSNNFHNSLLRDRYFENKQLINKLIRLVKSKKFVI